MRVGTLVPAAAVVLALGCSDPQGPVPTRLKPGAFIVSSPVPEPSPATSPGSIALRGPAVVYVSLPPGSIPTGVVATLRNLRTGSSTAAPMIDGGFDPVTLPALEGDTISIAVHSLNGPLSYRITAGPKSRPVVVRTSPPRHKRDVPLNSIVVIVFSQPLDPATIDGSSVRLSADGAQVPGDVLSPDPAHLRVEFHPANLLAPETDYQLVASTAIHDLNGVALDSAITVPFTTGPVPAEVATVSLAPPGLIVVGSQAPMSAVPLDAFGTPLPVSCAWSTSNVAVAAIASTGLLTALAPGTAVIRATCGGVFGEATATVVAVPSELVFAAMSAGGINSCGVTPSGAAYCWGDNLLDALGGGSTWWNTSPQPVIGGLSFAMISGAGAHSCGVTTSGVAYCWGDNSFLLGTGNTAAAFLPEAVQGGLTFASLSTGVFKTCGVTVGGAAYCWGRGEGSGELGNGTTNGSATPVPVAGGLSFASVSAGGWDHSCGLTSAGAAYCWGDNTAGELGAGTTTGLQQCGPSQDRPTGWPCSSVPVAVTGGLRFTQISTAAFHTCGVTTDGAAYCWGENAEGQLGTGDTTSSAVPVAVAGGLSFRMISAGDRHNCGITTSGAAYCWGYGYYGNLGDGSWQSSMTPRPVAGGLNFASVSAGGSPLFGLGYIHTCGITTSGVVYCWGSNLRGELGNGADIPYPIDDPWGEAIYGAASFVPVKVNYQP